MNLSCTHLIALNYGSFNMSNCIVTFNNFYNSQESIYLYKNVYVSANFYSNKFYKDFIYPKVILPSSTNSTTNNTPFLNSITV